MEMQLRAEQRIEKHRIAVMRDIRFVAIAGVLMTGKKSVVDDPKVTAATNGRDEIYGRQFVDMLPDKQLKFLILHEGYHKLLRHRTVWKQLKNKNPRLANIAMDFVINGMLDNAAGDKADNFIEFIPCGCLDHKYDGMNTMEVYKLLEKDAAEDEKKGQGSGSKGEPTDEHDFDNAGDMDELSEEEEKALEREVDTAIRQGAFTAGRMGLGLSRDVTSMLEANVAWEEVLQDFVTSNSAGRDLSTWRKPNRRWLSRGMYMPSSYSECTERITIGIDTSGSIGPNELQRFLSEVKVAVETANPKIIDIIYWDTEVASHEVYEGDAVGLFADSTKPKGGGGTRVGAMKEYMTSHSIKPDCIIIFTDGYVENDFGGEGWPAPVLWCMTTKIVAPFGKTLQVTV